MSAEEVRADQLSGVLPRFNPGKEFKRTLDAIEYIKNDGRFADGVAGRFAISIF